MAFQFLSNVLREASAATNNDLNDDNLLFYNGAEGGDNESDIDDEVLGALESDDESDSSENLDLVDVDRGDDRRHNGTGDHDDNNDGWASDLSNIPVNPFEHYDDSPLHNLTTESTPLDYFNLFISDDFIEELTVQTNLYAQQMQEQKNKTDDRWTPCSLADMKIFLYLNIYFGIKRLPHYAHYFSEHPLLHVEAVSKVISKGRYEKLSQYFHLNDSSKAHPKGHPEHDPLFKIRPMLDIVVSQSRALYCPGRDISFDEAMIQFTGRLYFKQYIRGKPTPWGVKVWCAADPRTGYLLDFSFYTGKSTLGPNGLGHDVITKLGERFFDRGHHFYFDNFFSGVKLASDLLQHGTYSCATIRPNRKGWPKDLSKKKKEQKGTIKMRQKGNLVATHWTDKRVVTVLSTACNPTTGTVDRRTKNGLVQREIPTPILEYNKSMGGVDLADQYRSYYPVGRRSKKWWRSSVWFLIQVSIINAWIVYRKSFPNNSMSHFDFRLSICMSLCQGNSIRKRRRADTLNAAGLAGNDPTEHVVVKLHGRKKCCVWCRKSGRKTPSNSVPETVFGCTLCQVHLCKDFCFASYHNELKN